MDYDYKKDIALAKKMGWNKHHSDDWHRYIAYLHEWADSHADETYMFMSPVCYDEWLDNERNFEYADGVLEGEEE